MKGKYTSRLLIKYIENEILNNYTVNLPFESYYKIYILKKDFSDKNDLS